MSAKRRLGVPSRVVGGQVAVTVVAAALALIWSADAAKAVFCGGAVAFLPNAYFALAIERAGGKGQATVEAAALLGRWGVKFALTVALLVLAIAVAGLGGVAFFVGLGVALATPLAAPLFGRGGERPDERPKDA